MSGDTPSVGIVASTGIGVIVPKQRGDDATWEWIAEKLGIEGTDTVTRGKVLQRTIEALKKASKPRLGPADFVGIDVETGEIIPIPKSKKEAEEIEKLGGSEPIGNVKPEVPGATNFCVPPVPQPRIWILP